MGESCDSVFLDLFRMIGPYPYLVITFLVMATVPIHGALRRLNTIESRNLLHLVGFIFSSSIFLFGNLLIVVLYGI